MPVALPLAIVGSAAIGAVASSSASSKASNAARDAATANNALQKQIYDQNSATLSPYVGAGNQATPVIQGLLGIGGDPAASAKAYQTYQGSTEYTSRLKQGQDSVTAALGSRGLLDSGAAQKALLKYGQTFGSNEFANYMGNLQNQQQTGLAAASVQAGVGQGYANAVSNNNNNAANNVGNAALSGANGINGALNSALGAYAMTQGMGSSYGGHSLGGSSISNDLYGRLAQGNGVG